MTIKEHASKASSQRRSGSRSPALARSIMALAIASRGCSSTPRLRRDFDRHLESDTQETNRLGIKPVALQVLPNRHGWQYGPQIGAVKPLDW